MTKRTYFTLEAMNAVVAVFGLPSDAETQAVYSSNAKLLALRVLQELGDDPATLMTVISKRAYFAAWIMNAIVKINGMPESDADRATVAQQAVEFAEQGLTGLGEASSDMISVTG